MCTSENKNVHLYFFNIQAVILFLIISKSIGKINNSLKVKVYLAILNKIIKTILLKNGKKRKVEIKYLQMYNDCNKTKYLYL